MPRKKPTKTPPRATGTLREDFARRMALESGFDALFDHLPGVSFFAKNSEFRIVAANRHFFQRFGFSKESDIIGKDDFDLFPQRLAEHFRADDEEVIRSGTAKVNIVELFFNQQGIPDWFITNKLPVRDRQGRVIGVMGTTQSYEGKKETLRPYLQIDRAVACIRERFRERLTVEELAALVHLSPRQLHRKFVETFGNSPQAFIMKLRIQAACEALQHSDDTISEVARTVGFNDQSAFTQQFHKHIGLTPLRFQQQFRLRRG